MKLFECGRALLLSICLAVCALAQSAKAPLTNNDVEQMLDAVAETIALLLSGAPDAFMSEVARRFAPPDARAADSSERS